MVNTKKPQKDVNNKVKKHTKKQIKKQKKKEVKKQSKKETKKTPTQKTPPNTIDKEITLKAKSLWTVNFKKIPPQKRLTIVNEILLLLTGSFAIASRKREHSRVLEICLKHTDNKNKLKFFKEIENQIPELSCKKHSMHVVISLIKNFPKRETSRFFAIFAKSGPVIIKNRHGSLVFDLFYRSLKPVKQFHLLKSLLYPPALLPDEYYKEISKETSLKELLDDTADATLKTAIIKNTKKVVNKIVSKEMLTTAVSHRLIDELSQNSDETKNELRERISSHPLELAQSKIGCKIAIQLFSALTPKEKKKFVKKVKENAFEMASDDYGWAVITSCLLQIDDTVLLKKTLGKKLENAMEKEFRPKIKKTAEKPKGEVNAMLGERKNENRSCKNFCKVLLQIINPLGTRFTSPEEIEVLKGLKEVGTCKKSFEKRQKGVFDLLAIPIVRFVKDNIAKVMRNPIGRELMFEIVSYSLKTDNSEIKDEQEEIMRKLAQSVSTAELKEAFLLHSNLAVRIVNFIASADSELSGVFFKALSAAVSERWFKGPVNLDSFFAYTQSRSAFVLVALMKAPLDPKVKNSLKTALKSCKAKLSKSDYSGSKILLLTLKDAVKDGKE